MTCYKQCYEAKRYQVVTNARAGNARGRSHRGRDSTPGSRVHRRRCTACCRRRFHGVGDLRTRPEQPRRVYRGSRGHHWQQRRFHHLEPDNGDGDGEPHAHPHRAQLHQLPRQRPRRAPRRGCGRGRLRRRARRRFHAHRLQRGARPLPAAARGSRSGAGVHAAVARVPPVQHRAVSGPAHGRPAGCQPGGGAHSGLRGQPHHLPADAGQHPAARAGRRRRRADEHRRHPGTGWIRGAAVGCHRADAHPGSGTVEAPGSAADHAAAGAV